jgi:hypothetical protein
MMLPDTGPHERPDALRSDLTVVAEAMREGRKTSRVDSRVLHDAVRTCAVNARIRRVLPEHLVRSLKDVVREVTLNDDTEAFRVIYTDRIIAWAIESYYELADR